MPETEMTVFERCVEALLARAGSTEYGPVVPEGLGAPLVRAVLTALAEHTGSPLTCDEVMRVLGEAG